MKLNIVTLGCVDYKQALGLQEKLLELVEKKELDDTLLLMEHPPVLTLGTRGDMANIRLGIDRLGQMGIDIFRINRGGDVTYHGPGQIIGYPILALTRHGIDIHSYIFSIQEAFIRLLAREYALEAQREFGKSTGVWIGNDKITAIGIAVRHGVSMHGFAFNVNTDLSHFSWINPCGLADRGVTSLRSLTGEAQDMDITKRSVAGYFCEAFGAEGRECSLESLTGS